MIFANKKIKKTVFLLFVFFAVFIGNAYSQSPKKLIEKQKEKIEKKKAQRANEAMAMYEKGLKRHLKVQSKDTKKRMRKSMRKADRINDNRREFFLKRWFAGKRTK